MQININRNSKTVIKSKEIWRILKEWELKQNLTLQWNQTKTVRIQLNQISK